jgi:glycosyltransferase involved in cell wall biosynthesis
MTSLTCLVFEPDVGGHRLQHVRHLADALLEIGCRVSLVLQSDVRQRAEYRVHLQPLESHIELHPRLNPRQGNRLGVRRERVEELLESIDDLRADWVYVPYADGITQVATIEQRLHGKGRFSQAPIEAQLMRGRYAYPAHSMRDRVLAAVNRWLTLRNPWHVTHLLDPWVYRALDMPPQERRFRLIPEPVEERSPMDRMEARQILKIPIEGRYVAMVGALESHKGIEQLLAAFANAKLTSDDRVLLVGKMAPQIRELVKDRFHELVLRGQIVTADRYVTDEELGAAFYAADVVAVTHPRPTGSSGTLVRAAAAERILLTSNYGWVGWVNDLFELGISVDTSNLKHLSAALEQALERSAGYRRSVQADRFCKFHTIANQKAHWVQTIGCERGIRLGSLAERFEWKWVTEGVTGRDPKLVSGNTPA